ncbi:hypothetical protein IH982_01615 [Patescibacteria group bacterium]|nr:hypothetical protein [Patescibacteria group bacterium]
MISVNDLECIKATLENAKALSERTPVFLYDVNHVKGQVERIKNAFSSYTNFKLLYAVKANNNPEILKQLSRMGLGFHVSSLEELKAARKVSKDISFTGPVLTSEILQYIKRNSVKANANSIPDLKKIASMKDVGLRINPRIGWSYGAGIASGSKESHFGVSPEEFRSIPAKLRNRITRLHMHTSSDSYRIGLFIEAFQRLLKITEKHPSVLVINIGGGIAAPIGSEESEFDITTYAKRIIAEAEKFGKKHKRILKIQVEPGNYIVRGAGYYIVRIHSVLQRRGRYYFFSDGTIHHIRGLLNERRPYSFRKSPLVYGAILGASCQVGDILVPFKKMPKLREGDLVAIPKAGAYCAVQAAQFNMIGFREKVCSLH